MSGNHALVEDDTALGIDAGGDVGGRHFARGGAQFGRILRLSERMQVDDAEDAVVVILQRDPVADRPEVIAEMQVAGRLDAGEDAVHWTPNWRSLAALLPLQGGAGQAGCRRRRLIRSRQSAIPSISASMANAVSPAQTSTASAPTCSIV